MTRKFLESIGIIANETIDKIIAENSADIEKIKSEFGTVTKELENLKAQLADRDKQLTDLKKSSGDNEELKKQIEALQAENKTQAETHAAELYKLRVDSAVDKALTAANAKNNTAVRALLKDLDKAELAEDGTVKGLRKQIEALAKDESTSFLFDNSVPQFVGFHPGGGETAPVDTSKMTYSQMTDYLKSHPDAKIQ